MSLAPSLGVGTSSFGAVQIGYSNWRSINSWSYWLQKIRWVLSGRHSDTCDSQHLYHNCTQVTRGAAISTLDEYHLTCVFRRSRSLSDPHCLLVGHLRKKATRFANPRTRKSSNSRVATSLGTSTAIRTAGFSIIAPYTAARSIHEELMRVLLEIGQCLSFAFGVIRILRRRCDHIGRAL